MSEPVPSAEPIQSILPCRSTGISLGVKAHKGMKVMALRHALLSQLGSDTCNGGKTHMNTKNHFHFVFSRNAPRNKAPKYPPMGADAPNSPRLRLRTLPGGFVVAIIATALGMIAAPPTPDKALMQTKAKKLLQNALIKVQMASQTPPSKSSRRWPSTSPRRPLIKTNVPWVKLLSVSVAH